MKKIKQKKFARYMRRTFKNKLYATLLLMSGILSTVLLHDATLLVFAACIAIPLFLAKQNWISD